MKANPAKLAINGIGLITLAVIIAVVVVNHSGPHYKGHSMEEWFNSGDAAGKVEAFRALGTNSLAFLTQKFDGNTSDCNTACYIVEKSFDRAEIERSGIRPKIEAMLRSDEQSEQITAYSAIRELGLDVPQSEIEEAMQTCPSVRVSEEGRIHKSKLAELASMTNSLDCMVISHLCNDPDPQIQMTVLGFLSQFAKHHPDNDMGSCAEEITAALDSLMKTTKDRSVLMTALAYMGGTQGRAERCLPIICGALDNSHEPGIQGNCIAILASLASTRPLSSNAQQSLKSLLSDTNLDPNVRGQASELLGYANTTQRRDNNPN